MFATLSQATRFLVESGIASVLRASDNEYVVCSDSGLTLWMPSAKAVMDWAEQKAREYHVDMV